MHAPVRTLVAAIAIVVAASFLPTASVAHAEPSAPLANDNFGDALAVTGVSGEVVVSNVGATAEPGEPDHADRSGGRSVWLTWTAPTTGTATISIASDDAAVGYAAAAYTGHTVDSLHELAAAAQPGESSILRFPVVASGRAHVAIDSLDSSPDATTSFTVRYTIFSPPNDSFATAQVLPATSGAASTTTFAATTQPGEPTHAGAARSVWLRWTAPGNGTLQLLARGTRPVSTAVAVYRGNSVAALEPLAASASGEITLPVATGHVYRIALAARSDTAGQPIEDDVVLAYRLVSPANDDLAGADVLLGPALDQSIAIIGSAEAGEPDHSGTPATTSRWYRWTPGQAGVAAVTVISGAARVALYRGSEVDDLTPLGPSAAVDATDTLLVAVDAVPGATRATVRFRVTAPSNDTPSGAVPLTVNLPSVATNLGGGRAGEPGVPGGLGAAVWFRVEPTNARTMHVHTAASTGDTVLGVFEDRGGSAPVLLAADDDSGPGHTSRVTFKPRAGTSYFVGVDTKDEPSARLVVTAGDPIVVVTGNEVAESDGIATFSVEASPARRQRVEYATQARSATSPEDFSARRDVVTLEAAAPIATIEVPIIDDDVDETSERLGLVVRAPGRGVVVQVDGEVVIADNDAAPSLRVTGGAAPEGAGAVPVTIAVDGVSERPVSVIVAATHPGSASVPSRAEPGDLVPTSRTVTLEPGVTELDLSLPIRDDAVDELDEEITIVAATLSRQMIVSAPATIVDDDAPPVLSMPDVDVDEDFDGFANVIAVPVTLSTASELDVSVAYATQPGTAIGPFDYRRASSVLTIPAGSANGVINVLLRPDNQDEDDEDLFLQLSSPRNTSLERTTSRILIVDDDAPPTLTVADASGGEESGLVRFVVTLSERSARSAPITVSYRAEPGSADESDYTPATGTLQLPAGEISAIIDITISDDALDEGDESFELVLDDPFQVTIADGTAEGTIVDDDKPTAS